MARTVRRSRGHLQEIFKFCSSPVRVVGERAAWMSWGSVAEWSKALVLGTSLFGGVGSNPTAAIFALLADIARMFYRKK